MRRPRTAAHPVLVLSGGVGLAYLAACSRPVVSTPPLPDPATCTTADIAVQVTDVERDGVTSFALAGEQCALTRTEAMTALLDRLLFVGVPQSTQTLPMLEQPDVMRQRPTAMLQQLRMSGGRDFLSSADSRGAGRFTIRYDVTGLRRWLERQGLARRFGLP